MEQGYNHSLNDLFNAVSSPFAYFVIDGIDRLFREKAFRNLAILLNILQNSERKTCWKILLTAQSQELRRITDMMMAVNISIQNWHQIVVGNPDFKALNPVWKKHPSLLPLFAKDYLAALLIRMKNLDSILRNIDSLPDTQQWVGESDLIQWLWKAELSQLPEKIACEGFLLRLAQIEGDELTTGVPKTEFTTSDLMVCDHLEKARLCATRGERIGFAHDLYGDWARQRVLLSKFDNALEFVNSRMASPLWHHALRLFSQHILEQNPDTLKWKEMLHVCSNFRENGVLMADIFLEAVVHTPDAFSNLEKIREELWDEEGKLLRRLLTRFLYVASLPDRRMLELFGKKDDSSISVLFRIPKPVYWPSTIRFLYANRETAIELAPNEISEICEKWLLWSDDSTPYGKEAGKIALETAWLALEINRLHPRNYSKGGRNIDPKKSYRAALAAVKMLPNQAVDFSLTACGRKKAPPLSPRFSDRKTKAEVTESDFNELSGKSFFDSIKVPPWPDGPNFDVDRDFRELCLNNSDALAPMIFSRPEIAREIILALLIREPGSRLIGTEIFLRDHYELNPVPEWFPVFYDNGPFLLFLYLNPNEGLNLILRLINFVTERWIEYQKNNPDGIPCVTIPFSDDATKVWYGDKEMYTAYNGGSSRPTEVVVCALMALEKWFYVRMNQNESVGNAIHSILKNTQSLAFAGLLVCIGKKNPDLFKGPLKSFLAVPEFYAWDDLEHQIFGFGFRQTKNAIDRAIEWQDMPHRKQPLGKIAFSLFQCDLEIRDYFETIRKQWKKRLDNTNLSFYIRDYLEKLLLHFSTDNWKPKEMPGHGICWEFQGPREFFEKAEKTKNEWENRQLTRTFPFECFNRIKNHQPLQPEELKSFWELLQKIENSDEFDDKFESTPNADSSISESFKLENQIKIQNSLCAGAALLINFHLDWLRKYPSKEKWCIKTIKSAIFSPPPMDPFYFPGSDSWRWDVFCALVIPVLWAESPGNKTIRKLVAKLAISYHYNIVKVLIEQSAKCRQQLGDDFPRLLHLILRWAWAGWELHPNRKRTWRKKSEEKKYKTKVAKKMEKDIQAFIKGELSPELPLWDGIPPAGMKNLSIPEIDSTEFHLREDRGIDIELIWLAFEGLPLLSDAIDEKEKGQWLVFWKEALNCTLKTLRGGDEKILKIDGTLRFDQWIFDKIVWIIFELDSPDEQKAFWKPILNLGSPAHFWIGDFLSSWFMLLFQENIHHGVFVQVWKDMLDFAFASPKWNYRNFESPYEIMKLWRHLVGLDAMVIRIWDDKKYTPIVKQMRGHYEQWASLNLVCEDSAEMLILFLRKPAADEIRMDGLLWLGDAASQLDDHFWHDPENKIRDSLSELLNHYWHNDRIRIRQSRAHWDKYKNFLKILVERQNPLAMKLSEEIV